MNGMNTKCLLRGNEKSRSGLQFTKTPNHDRKRLHNVKGNLFVMCCNEVDGVKNAGDFVIEMASEDFKYRPIQDDFGPIDLGVIQRFLEIVESKNQDTCFDRIILKCSTEPAQVTNAVFLAGCFLVLHCSMDADQAVRHLRPFDDLVVSYRDVSPGMQNFHLHLRDCWAGLHKALAFEWIKPGLSGFDASEYSYYSNQANADAHVVVPGKFIAMRGPKALPPGQTYEDVHRENGLFHHRTFSPAHVADVLRHFRVQAVVRLCRPEYDRHELEEAAGVAFADLPFDDCAAPPPDVVAKFMIIAEGVPGALAVHCGAGLGRTGTLIALYLMQHHGFTAREAMGWLRIVRPGSVVGAQQDYLAEREEVMRRSAACFARDGPQLTLAAAAAAAAAAAGVEGGVGAPGGDGPSSSPLALAELIARAVETVDKRLAARRVSRRRSSLLRSSESETALAGLREASAAAAAAASRDGSPIAASAATGGGGSRRSSAGRVDGDGGGGGGSDEGTPVAQRGSGGGGGGVGGGGVSGGGGDHALGGIRHGGGDKEATNPKCGGGSDKPERPDPRGEPPPGCGACDAGPGKGVCCVVAASAPSVG